MIAPRRRVTIGPSAAWVSRTSATTLSRISRSSPSTSSSAKRAEGAEAGVVHEEVDGLRRDRASRASTAATTALGRAGRPRAPRRATPCAARELGGDSLEPSRVAGDEHEVVAARGERVGERRADPGRRAGDERGASSPLTRFERAGDGAGVGVDRRRPTCTSLIARLRILEAVAGHRAHDASSARRAGRRPPPGAARRPTPPTPAPRSTPSSAASSRYASRISASVTAPMWPPDSSRAAIAPCPRRRVADPDRGGDRLGVQHRLAAHDRRRARGLPARASAACAWRAPSACVLACSPASTR